jgi:phytoene dehydrogenase-like protein
MYTLNLLDLHALHEGLPLEGSEFLTAQNVTSINIHQQVTVVDGQECVDINAIGHQAAHVHDVQPEQIFVKVSDKQAINCNRKDSPQSC